MESQMKMSAARIGDLDRIAAETEIRQLPLQYAHAFLVRDEALLLSLWASIETPAEPHMLDRDWAHALVARWHSLGTTMLHVTNHLITFEDPSKAHGHVQCLAQLDRGEEFIEQSILYEDRYVYSDGRWLFAMRDHRLWFGTIRDRHPMRQAPAAWPASQVGSGSLPDDLRHVASGWWAAHDR